MKEENQDCTQGRKFSAAFAKLAKFTNLSHHFEFLHFAVNHCKFDLLYLLMSQNRSFSVFCSITDEIRHSSSVATRLVTD